MCTRNIEKSIKSIREGVDFCENHMGGVGFWIGGELGSLMGRLEVDFGLILAGLVSGRCLASGKGLQRPGPPCPWLWPCLPLSISVVHKSAQKPTKPKSVHKSAQKRTQKRTQASIFFIEFVAPKKSLPHSLYILLNFQYFSHTRGYPSLMDFIEIHKSLPLP